MLYGESGAGFTNEDANTAANITCEFMRRNDGMYPFYREAIGRCVLNETVNGLSIAGVVRQEFNLWERCPETAIRVSQEILRRVWRRLA